MDMPQNQDFKYVLQDFGNIYIGARYSYEEMLKSEAETIAAHQRGMQQAKLKK